MTPYILYYGGNWFNCSYKEIYEDNIKLFKNPEKNDRMLINLTRK